MKYQLDISPSGYATIVNSDGSWKCEFSENQDAEYIIRLLNKKILQLPSEKNTKINT